MNEVNVDMGGRELRFLVGWLVDNIENDWHISIWRNFIAQPLSVGPYRTAPYRISSDNWQHDVYKVSGLSDHHRYTVIIMLYDNIDTMAVKLRW